jgi:hypothetical protein
MSLWQKAVTDLTFEDVDAFLTAKVPEGHRLDYKKKFPDDLAKTIAAFANTLGGMIILGVDADKATNEPVWPPVEGMASGRNTPDRITQIATDGIYPPVRVRMKQMANERLAGNDIVVIRIDESKEAPHAVDKGRKVYVYERTDNKNSPREAPAHIDQISYMLDRRKRIEERRDDIRTKAIIRARPLIYGNLNPVIWVSVIPVYPWRSLCSPRACYAIFQGRQQICVRRIPDGAMYISLDSVKPYGRVTAETITCDVYGHYLHLRGIVGLTQLTLDESRVSDQDEHNLKLFSLTNVHQRISWMLDGARTFYRTALNERPGLLSIKLGMQDVKGVRFRDPSSYDVPEAFLDANYEDEITMEVDAFLSTSGGIKSMEDRITYAFDVRTPESLSE